MAINLTPVSEVLQGVVSFLPDLVDFVIAVLPVIIVLTIVGFIVGFFDGIVAWLRKAL